MEQNDARLTDYKPGLPSADEKTSTTVKKPACYPVMKLNFKEELKISMPNGRRS